MNTLACCLFAAFSATVGELPPCDYADTIGECASVKRYLPGFKLSIK